MTIKRAKVLTDEQFEAAYARCDLSESVLRDRLILLLSFKQGMRAAEIAALHWDDVLDAVGTLAARDLFISGRGAKGKHARQVALHPRVYKALLNLYGHEGRTAGPVLLNDKRQPYTANAIVQWFARTWEACGYRGCSSHSGRRTALTTLARLSGEAGCSIVDVQRFAGHADLKTTQAYVDSSERVARLVAAL